MPTTAEKNQFRRLVGDYGKNDVSDIDIASFLNDTTYELTADFVNSNNVSAPVTSFDSLYIQYHPEVIYAGAINYLWNKLGKLADRHRQSVGQASSDASEKFDHVMQMIDKLTIQYQRIQYLGSDITMGNLSRFSKTTLTRQGGQREEDALDEF